jgi:hypothetical protein
MDEREYILTLRTVLESLRARHDGGTVPAATCAEIREIETTIAWIEHRAGRGQRRILK